MFEKYTEKAVYSFVVYPSPQLSERVSLGPVSKLKLWMQEVQ